MLERAEDWNTCHLLWSCCSPFGAAPTTVNTLCYHSIWACDASPLQCLLTMFMHCTPPKSSPTADRRIKGYHRMKESLELCIWYQAFTSQRCPTSMRRGLEGVAMCLARLRQARCNPGRSSGRTESAYPCRIYVPRPQIPRGDILFGAHIPPNYNEPEF